MNTLGSRAARAALASALVVLTFLLPGPRPASAATPLCHDQPATLVAAPGAASIRGTQGDDVIVALDGDIRIDASGGNDIVWPAPAATSSTAAPATTGSMQEMATTPSTPALATTTRCMPARETT